MKTPLEISIAALQQIVDIEKSATVGWNGLSNAVHVAKQALANIRQQEGLAIDKAIDNDIDYTKEQHGMEGL